MLKSHLVITHNVATVNPQSSGSHALKYR